MSNITTWYRHFGQTLRCINMPAFYRGYTLSVLEIYFEQFTGITEKQARILAKLWMDKCLGK